MAYRRLWIPLYSLVLIKVHLFTKKRSKGVEATSYFQSIIAEQIYSGLHLFNEDSGIQLTFDLANSWHIHVSLDRVWRTTWHAT